ncbi:MAG: hypothetical protein ACKO4S_10950, partial [Snowella sp.]
FSRFEDATTALTISFSVGGTAVYGTDYSQTGADTFSTTVGTITFAANSKVKTLTLATSNAITTNKDVIITVTSVPGYTVGASNSATGSITP